jgi:RNA polymerase sigma factor (sigma-70 family)
VEDALEDVYRRRYVGFRNALATVTGSYDTARRIALRAALDGQRRRKGLAETVELDLLEPERDPELAEAIRALPPRRRLIVFLRYFADFSYEQIAAACDVSEGTVAATLAQAHEALAETIGRREVG